MLVPRQGTTMKDVGDLFFTCTLHLAFVYNITGLRSMQTLKWREKIADVLLLGKDQIKKLVLPFKDKQVRSFGQKGTYFKTDHPEE